MSWIYNKRLFHITVLLLFILAFIGPWAFDALSVPAEYPCNPPAVRLSGDICGYPMSGFVVLRWFGGGLFNILGEWLLGNFTGRGGEFLAILYILIAFLPIVDTLSSIAKKNSRPWRTANIILWGLACFPILHYWFIMAHSPTRIFHVWGFWMYSSIIIGAIIFELLSRTRILDHTDQQTHLDRNGWSTRRL